MESKTYHEQKDIQNTKKLRQLRSFLPQFLGMYFRGIEHTTASNTRLAYAVDLKTFFEFISKTNPFYKNMSISDYPLQLLDEVTAQDIEEYMEYLKLYKNENGQDITNDERAIKRKLAALRSMYQYYQRNQMVKMNPCLLVSVPKLRDKAIIRLDTNEISTLLDSVESGDKLTKKQKQIHKKNQKRDLALMTLMLGTGVRVSECVGLDLQDIDLANDRIKVIRKGGYESFVYFGDEVKEALLPYLEQRNSIQDIVKGHENALFLSDRKQRLSVRSVEILVKKYAQTVTTLKKITPHKLRSTYGTALYRQTNDIYLVADVLGHKDVNTTKKHYEAMEEEHRCEARNKVILRGRENET